MRKVALAVAGLVMGGAILNAQIPAARHVRSAPLQRARVIGSPLTTAVGSFSPLRSPGHLVSLLGSVQNQMGVPVPHAGEVILRDVRTGRALATAQVNDSARFEMRSFPPGLYTAELIGRTGSIVASTPAFAASAGEVIQISQTIPIMPAQGLSRVLATATSTALSTAASSGVLAVAPGAPVTPRQ